MIEITEVQPEETVVPTTPKRSRKPAVTEEGKLTYAQLEAQVKTLQEYNADLFKKCTELKHACDKLQQEANQKRDIIAASVHIIQTTL